MIEQQAKRWMMLVALVSIAATKPPVERVVTGDGIVPVTINGAGGRMRVDPGATGLPLVDAEWAKRAALKPGMFGISYGIGPTRVAGSTAVGRTDFGAGPRKRRIGWAAKAYAAGIDGVVGPGGVPEPVVRFVLRAPRPGERTTSFRMVDQGGLFGGMFDRYAMIDVGGAPMRLRLDPHHPRTLATAGAGVRLAAAFGGQMEGKAIAQEIAFGVERPVRDLVLARPLMLGPLAIDRLGVRTGDYGTVAAIADADAPPVAADPDEIVVVAKGKKRVPSRDLLALGADVLARCSSIVFDKPAKIVRLTCG